MKQDPAVVAAQNKHKIEKDKRRKHYHDLQVQGTNNSSIVSKRSVEMIYNKTMSPESKEWFKFFVPKAKRRSPAINRGYWVRMEAICRLVLEIARRYPELPVQVVNLGCGFDPLPFQLLDEHPEVRFRFLDFDYPGLVEQKLEMVQKSPEILDVIGKPVLVAKSSELGVVLATDAYVLVGCDLKNLGKYESQLSHLLRGPGPTIFVAEVSLAYMTPEHANAVVQALAAVPNCHFLVLEQIMPSGPHHFFAQKMLYHFSHLLSPLQCVETYSTKNKQRDRFRHYFPSVSVVDMLEAWQQLVPLDRKRQLASVEDFDEWEEFIVFCQHYVVIHATNSQVQVLEECADVHIPDLGAVLDMKVEKLEKPVELKFPAACCGDNGVYMHGGMWQSRNSDLWRMEGSLELVNTESRPQPRMCHTLTDIAGGRLLLVGGRTRPGHNLGDVWLYRKELHSWTQVGELDNGGCSRHSALCVGEGKVLLFANGNFLILHVDQNDKLTAQALLCEDSVPSVQSCGFTYNAGTNVGYIAGGMCDPFEPTFNTTVYRFRLGNGTVTVQPILSADIVGRIGCALHMENADLYVLGGVGSTLATQSNSVLRIDTEKKAVAGVAVLDEIWRTYPVLIGFQLAGDCIIGGGAVCYSFGSVYSPTYRVEWPSRSEQMLG